LFGGGDAVTRGSIRQVLIALFATIPLGFGVVFLLFSTVLNKCGVYDGPPPPSVCHYGTAIAYGAWLLPFPILLLCLRLVWRR
jgi:hypothetical protein